MGSVNLSEIFISQPLKDKLCRIPTYPITTVIAPMGYGKTTAIKWWSSRRTKANQSAIFLRQMVLTGSLTDFWTDFCKLFRDFPSIYDRLKLLPFPKDLQSLSLCSEILNRALSGLDQEIYYILDDLHLLPTNAITPFILFFSKDLPDNIHIILLSRNQIFNRKERMELGHRLGEFAVSDLSLNRQDLADYADLCGVRASQEELDQLATSSEGWFSIIYLNFKNYIKNGKWLSGSVDTLTLINEVLLDPLTQEEKDFLILNGISDVFTKDQAAYLWADRAGARSSDDLLNFLTKNNAFISKTDHLYHYHHMLRQSARYYFAQKPQAYQDQAYSRLGDWYMDQGDYLPAYFAYAKAGNYEKLLSCLEKDRAKSLNYDHREAFSAWMDQCPEDILLDYPSALTVGMLTMFTFNNIEGLYRLKDLLLKSLEINDSLSEEEKNNLLGDAEISESLTAFNRITAMSAYQRRACALLSRPTYSVDPEDLWTFGSPSVFMLYHREAGLADQESAEMKDCMPYYYQVTDGHGNGSDQLFAAELHFERGQWLDAEISNKMALAAAKRKKQTSIILACEFLNMRLDLLYGNDDQIEDRMTDLKELLHSENQYELLDSLDLCQMFMAAVLNRPQEAPQRFLQGRVSETLITFPAIPILHTYYNQLLLAKGEYIALIARQEECDHLYGIFSNLHCSIWLYIQLAAAYEQIGKREEALSALKTALDMAMPDGILMPFAENRTYISDRLLQVKKEDPYAPYIDQIMALSDQVEAGKAKILNQEIQVHTDFGLSDREYEIAKLAANRMTTAEIAKRLHLSQGTVRNHLSRVFSKMDISGTAKNKKHELEKRFRG